MGWFWDLEIKRLTSLACLTCALRWLRQSPPSILIGCRNGRRFNIATTPGGHTVQLYCMVPVSVRRRGIFRPAPSVSIFDKKEPLIIFFSPGFILYFIFKYLPLLPNWSVHCGSSHPSSDWLTHCSVAIRVTYKGKSYSRDPPLWIHYTHIPRRRRRVDR